MAFDFNNNDQDSTSNETGATRTNRNENWKSDAFINFALPKEKGKTGKIGFCGLKMSKADHAELIKFFREGGDDAIERFKELLIIDFQMADGSTSGSFKLS